MSKSSAYSVDLLEAELNATAIANLLDNASASPATTLTLALHTADPSAGDQTTSEVSYTGYTRVTVARTSGGWTVTSTVGGAQAVNAATIAFPASTGGADVDVTHISVGTGVSDNLMRSGALSSPITIVNGNPAPEVAAGALVLTET
ncbi:MAG: phage tail fiber protein [Pseudomonadaceae bacterium]